MRTFESDKAQVARLRIRIDRLNIQLLRLLESRARLVRTIMAVKRRVGAGRIDRAREDQMIRALLGESRGVLSPHDLERLFRCLFRVSRGLGRGLKPDRRRQRICGYPVEPLRTG
jgi:3-deoxy-7-phosphoheptulonate synthase/chorismate mutase